MSEHNGGAWREYASLLFSLMLLIMTGRAAPLQASSSDSSDACLTRVRTSVSTVTLQLVDRVRLPAATRAEMMRETIEIWRAAGVDVEWSTLPAAGTAEMTAMSTRVTMEPSHPEVVVIVTPDIPEALIWAPEGAHVMASILFIENRPTKLIGAYPTEVQRMLESMRSDPRPLTDRPAVLRQRLMGRVLGRSIAHELGHFLFGSSAHAPDGLMRARHRADDLTSPFRQAFRVIAASQIACGGLASMNGSGNR